MYDKRNKILLTFLCVLMLAPVSWAETVDRLPSSYLDVRLVSRSYGNLLDSEFDDGGATIEGGSGSSLGVAGTVALSKHFYLTGEYDEGIDIDLAATVSHLGDVVNGFDTIESRYGRLALGIYWPTSESFGFFAELGAEHVALRLPGTFEVATPSGITLRLQNIRANVVEADAKVGLRLLLGERVELSAHSRYSQAQLGHPEVSDRGQIVLNDELLFGAGLTFYPHQKIGVGATYEVGDVDTGSFFVRFNF